MKKTAIIMAGGFGERFWPLSRMNRPKQILNLTSNDMNMLQESISKIDSLIDPQDIFVITSAELLNPIRNSLTELPPENIIAEPAKRNTAPCLALGSAIISARYKDLAPSAIVTAVLTADHKIEPKENFIGIVAEAMQFVSKADVLSTIGIKPTRPETGYGYIETGMNLSGRISHVIRFREKPDNESAIKYFNSGNFLWNSGIFFWKLSTFNKQMNEYFPAIGSHIQELTELYKDCHSKVMDGANEKAFELFESMPSISIDYALMEKSDDVVCINSDFDWDDVGAWDSLYRVRQADENGNILTGNNLILETKNCIIVNDNSDEITVTGIGLENLVIINTKDSIMICPKDRAQDVKKIVEKLRDSGRTELL